MPPGQPGDALNALLSCGKLGKDNSVSNTPSSRVVLRIQPSALIFAVMILGLGALLLATNSMDPRVGERPRLTPTAIDIYANVRYTAWKSPDGIFQFELPELWSVQANPNAQLYYQLVGQGNQGAPITFFLVNTSQILQQIPASANVNVNSTPEQLLSAVIASQRQGQPAVQVRSVQAGTLKGASAHFTETGQDTTGQAVSVDAEVMLLSLDPGHVMAIQAQSRTAEWPKLQPILTHFLETLKVDTAAAVKILDATPTPVATVPATTSAATAAPTSAR
jgi:hypothetical protein